MPQYPTVPVSQEIVGVLANAFDGGSGPKGPALSSAIAFAGIDSPYTGTESKQARVHRAFRTGTTAQGYALVDELLRILRKDGAFSDSRDWVGWALRARAAFRRAGWVLDANGDVNWSTAGDPQGLLPFVEPAGSIAAAAVDIAQKAGAAKARAAARPAGVVGRRETPSGVPIPTHSPGDAVGSLTPSPKREKIFLVHGHNEAARNAVQLAVIEMTGIQPVVLAQEANGGRTVIEKFEAVASESSYAIVLMTADDLGHANADGRWGTVTPRARARQNVVFEFGYFAGFLGRDRVAALVEHGVEQPSDLGGFVYIEYGTGTEWRNQLRRELKKAEFPISG